MARSFLPVALLGLLLAGCSDDAQVEGDEPPVGFEDGGGDDGRGTVPAATPSDPPFGDPMGSNQLACGTPEPIDLGASDSRYFHGAARALAEIQLGTWPEVVPSSGELFAYLGPRVGPEGGRFIGRMTSTRVDAFYVPAVVTPEPVHVIVVVDLGPSIRAEVPLVIGALETLAGRIAGSSLPDQLSVVEWTDEGAVGIRLATGTDVQGAVGEYAEALRARVQFGGSPSLSVVADPIRSLASETPTADHVILLTDGSLSTKDSATLDAVTSWRAEAIGVSLVELQAVDPAEHDGHVTIHEALLADRALSDAAFYLAASVTGDPSRPPARAIAPEHFWQIQHLFGDRFDDLFRPTELFAHVEVAAPPELRLEPFGGTEEPSDLPGGVRLGSNGSVFAQAAVTEAVCGTFIGEVRVLGVRASDAAKEIEIARGEVTFDMQAGLQAYGMLLGALESIGSASETKSCENAAIGEKRGKLAEVTTEGMGEGEATAFEKSREHTLLVLDSISALCPAP